MLNNQLLFHKIHKDYKGGKISEIILALPATIDGQITAHYLVSKIKEEAPEIKITTLAQGIPMGAELDYMDEGTLQLALNSRKNLE